MIKQGRCRRCQVRPITLMPQSNEQLQKCQYPSLIHPFGKQKGATLPFKLSHLPLKYHQHTLFAKFEMWPPVQQTSFHGPPLNHHLRVSTHRYLSSTLWKLLQLLGFPDDTDLFHGSLEAAVSKHRNSLDGPRRILNDSNQKSHGFLLTEKEFI